MPRFNRGRRALLCGVGGIAAFATLPGRAADGDEPVRLVDNLAQVTIAIIGDRGLSRRERTVRLHALIDRNFDIVAIGRFVLGPYWQDADEADRREFVALFQDYLATVYARSFELHGSRSLAVSGSRPAGDDAGTLVVESELHGTGTRPLKIDWSLSRASDGWRIYDVTVDSISLGVTLRGEITSVMKRNGGRLPLLIDQLRELIRKLA